MSAEKFQGLRRKFKNEENAGVDIELDRLLYLLSAILVSPYVLSRGYSYDIEIIPSGRVLWTSRTQMFRSSH